MKLKLSSLPRIYFTGGVGGGGEGGLIVFNVILSEDFVVVNRMELFIYYTRGSINFDPFSYLIPFSPRNFNWIVILS